MEGYTAELDNLRQHLNFSISNEKLIGLALSISRVADKKITNHINDFKTKHNLKLSALEKNSVRDYILGLDTWKIKKVTPIKKTIIDKNDVYQALQLINVGIERNEAKVIGTIRSRLNKKANAKKHLASYLEIIKAYEQDKNQLLIINVSEEDENTADKVKSIINQEYDALANYHYAAIVFADTNWHTISDIAIYCESFMQELNFAVFNRQKDKKIEELNNFIKSNQNIKYSQKITDKIQQFYQGVSYGFQFNDLLVSDTDNTKVLILQKIELDETILPCPDCLMKQVRGNSYPRLLQRSFECQNPNCPSRSKIGRGKRFDYFSVKRNTYLKYQDNNLIDKDLLKKFRRDIFSNNKDVSDMLVQFFSWSDDKIKYVSNTKKLNTSLKHNRTIEFKAFSKYKVTKPKKVLIHSLLSEVASNIKLKSDKPTSKIIEKNYRLYEGNSSNILNGIKEQFSGVITSPPYYNAREYSQWPTMLCYLIDMTINAKAVFNRMENGTYYFYNVGDIVGQDNIFVSSHMSKRRLMLGFYSIMVFEMLGYKLHENIIWDKGEVQSKRNSTENVFPTYIKPINCYEHILVFGKKAKKVKLGKEVVVIDTVKKINSKGENMLGHTAPYPEALVELVFPYLYKSQGYLLDPYLGSGTTIIAGQKHGYKTVGIESNKNYFKLASKRIKGKQDKGN